MANGRVVVVKEYQQPFVIEEYPVPEPEPGAIVLRITQAGVCGSDLHTWRGDMVETPLPSNGRVMGHEGTGVVHALGDGVSTDSLGREIEVGDRLMYSAITPCGRCYQCSRGEPNWCSDRGAWSREAGVEPYFTGTYADYFWILKPNHPVYKVPDELPDSVLGFDQLRDGHRRPRACSAPASARRTTTWWSRARAASASTPPRWRRTWARTSVIVLDRIPAAARARRGVRRRLHDQHRRVRHALRRGAAPHLRAHRRTRREHT